MRTWLRMPVLAATAAALLVPSLAVSVPAARASANPDGTVTMTIPAASKDGAYQVKVPSRLDGASVTSASVTSRVACSGSPKLTLWVSRPGGQPLGGGIWHASRDVTCGSGTASFPVTGAVRQAAGNDWRTFTFKVSGPSGTKVSSPKLRVTYVQPAAVPSSPAVSAGSLKNAPCAGSPLPAISPGTAATMQAGAYDSAGAPVTTRFTYWVKGSPEKTSVTSAPARSGQTSKATIPASFTRGLARNAVVDWSASAVSPSASSPSAVCGMAVSAAAAQGAPVISGGPSSDPVPGTQETYTVTAAAAAQSGVTPAAVAWGLDNPPPASGPDSSQTVSIASGGTSAQVQVVVPSPGPHAFYAYVRYSDGSISDTATSAFTAGSDPAISCPDFASALTSTGCVQADGTTQATSTAANTMISNGSGDASGTADADGFGSSLPASQLQAAGWKPGGNVIVDGATFTLPQFGSSSSGNDNLLAAGQTIGMGGAQGSSLVFLAAGTDTDTSAPPPSQVKQPMSPVPAAGTPVTGQVCDRYQTSIAGTNCQPAPSGTITYTGASPQTYDLEAPDWQKMNASQSVVTLSQHSTSSGLAAGSPGLYAVSVPLNPQAPVASVTLPDVGALARVATGVGWPAMHILGVAVANTTTSTPGNLPSSIANAAGPWTGGWASPPEAPRAPQAGTSYSNQTIRLVTQVSTGGTQVSASGGAAAGIAVRLRLSDALADVGTGPLNIGAVTVAPQSSGAAVSGTPVPATFDTSQSVTIPEGGDVYSDPVILPALTAGEQLTVSIDLTGSYPSLPTATYCSACTEYVSASGSGDQTANTDGSPFSGTGTATGDFSSILTGVDVLNAGTTPKPTVSVLGNGVIDGNASGSAAIHSADRVSDDLASSLRMQPGGPAFGVVNGGVEANQVLGDADTGTGSSGGPAALSRLARDVLAEPGIGTVVIGQGNEDLIHGTSEQDLYTNGLAELSRELTAWGITTIWTTQSACYGYAPCTTSVDNARSTINADLLSQGMPPGENCSANAVPPCQYTADFAKAVAQPDLTGYPDELTSGADAGDHVNLSPAGYTAQTRTIPVIAGSTPLAADVPPSY